MTDTITPASLRAHADHMERVHLDGISAEEMRQEAARLEAEAARDEEALEYAKVYRSAIVEVAPIQVAWDGLPDDYREMHVRGIRAVLDGLAADGRLLPEGGTGDTPDGTPEKPWPSLHAVPASVHEVRDAAGFHWGRRSDVEWKGCCAEMRTQYCASGHSNSAPFVRVDGDKA
ncbi:hypothetical protein GS489_22960 [Rhodococcus hoagii]|nr:hypothetical protein [Prescottella equi]